MKLYWLVPIFCGALGFGLSCFIKRYISTFLKGQWLENLVLSEKATRAISNGIGQKLVGLTQDTRTISEVLDLYIGKEERVAATENVSCSLAAIITVELKESQIADIILEEIKRVLEEKAKLGFLTGFMKGNLWEMVREPMEKAIENYLDERCQPMLEEKLKEKCQSLSEKRMYEVGEILLKNSQLITDTVLTAYKNNIVDIVNQILNQVGPVEQLLYKPLVGMQAVLTGFGIVCGLFSVILTIILK